MATSTKVMFKLEELKKRALEALDERIELAEAELDVLEQGDSWEEQIEQWRNDQLTRVQKLLEEWAKTDNDQLARFRVDSPPSWDGRVLEMRRMQGTLRYYKELRGQIKAKAASLVPDAEGNIALTKTQLSEFFGL